MKEEPQHHFQLFEQVRSVEEHFVKVYGEQFGEAESEAKASAGVKEVSAGWKIVLARLGISLLIPSKPSIESGDWLIGRFTKISKPPTPAEEVAGPPPTPPDASIAAELAKLRDTLGVTDLGRQFIAAHPEIFPKPEPVDV